MSLQKFASWLLTDAGKHFSFCVASTAVCGSFVVQYLPNTFLIDKYKDIVHLYKSGLSVPLSEHLKKRFEKAVELAGISQDERKLYKPFPVYGFDMFSAGTGYSKYGCIIGLPANFSYNDVESIDRSVIKINNESVPWGVEEGDQLLKSLVLSEKAQLYAIAREIKMSESAKVPLDILYPTIATISCYGMSMKLNRTLNLYIRPLGLRLMLYSLVAAFVFGNYIFAKDFTQVYYEQKVDEFLKNKDPVFLEGGKEYYEKILNRNKALRKLMGKAGESYYSVLGNENYFIRQKHVPLIKRKEFFEGKGDLEFM